MPSKQLKPISHSRQLLLLCIFTVLAMLAGGHSTQVAAEIGFHKVIALKNTLMDDGHHIILWHDYGSYGLYRVRKDVWQQLPQQVRSATALADDMEFLILDGKTIDSLQGVDLEPDSLEIYDGKALHLIQFVGPIKDEWLKSVKATGTELVHYIANNGYLVWTRESGRQQLQLLAKQGDFLQYSVPYLPSFKLGSSLGPQQNMVSEEDELVTVTVQIFRHAGDIKSETIITDLFVDTLSSWESILKYQNIIGVVHRKDIPKITRLPDVVWVGERFPRELTDEVQGMILAGSLNLSQTAPVGPGYLGWFSSLALSTDPNDYPIVDITDDGIGNGQADIAAGDVTLREMGNANKPSRIAYIANCTSEPSGAGPGGHGHINISIAGGYDDRTDSPYRDDQGFQRGLGINPYGRFAGTRVFDAGFNLSGCGGTEQSLIRQTYFRGARIVSNSWSCQGCAGTYDDSSQTYDAGVRDADPTSPGNQELSILFSAGNSGPEANTIGSPGNGKNMITVGASENVRPSWIDGCAIRPTEADNVQDIADFSSRGPAPGGRIKPDLIAPGTHIQGTASTDPNYTGQRVCDKYLPVGQILFASSSGTSHSTPAVAGIASLAHTYIRLHEGVEAPSPALLKGFLIANTSYLSGGGAGGDLPSQSQGYGLPDMTDAFDNTPRVLIDQGQALLFNESGETWSKTLSVADPSKPVRVVLAYTDQPGAIGTHPQVNDLNLTVQANGITHLGNYMSGQWSVPGGSADKVNNVEAVFLPSVNDTTLQIVVTAFNIGGDGVPGVGDETDQDFTIVCSNCVVQEDFIMNIDPVSNNICLPGSAEYTINIGSVLNFSDPVALQVADTPSDLISQFDTNPVVPPDQSLLTFTAGEDVTPGTYEVTVSGNSATRQHSHLLNLDIFSKVPLAPELLSPEDDAVDQPLDVTLSWSQVAQAASYDVEIATDFGFEQIVDGSTGLTGTTFSPSRLKSGKFYYWRVRALNGCGTGSSSKTYLFSTELLIGACPLNIVSNVLYETDFEGSVAGWSSEGVEDTWILSTAKSHSSNTSFYAQDVGRISNQMLVSPEIILPPFEGPLTLQFWNYQALESNEVDDEICFDGALLEITTDDGNSWQQLGGLPGDNSKFITDPYDGFVSNAHENPLAGSAAWCGDPQEWINSVVRLDDFAEQTVRFRFRLGTDESIGQEGWYVDDVLVQSCPINLAFMPVAISPQAQPK